MACAGVKSTDSRFVSEARCRLTMGANAMLRKVGLGLHGRRSSETAPGSKEEQEIGRVAGSRILGGQRFLVSVVRVLVSGRCLRCFLP